MTEDSIGIDVSKAKLDVHRLSDGAYRIFDNTPSGLKALREWLVATQPARVVYESTGPYHAMLERHCAGHLPLVKVNPLQARRFAQSLGSRAKTDKVDAAMLARMGEMHALQPDEPASQEQHELRELQVARMALVKDRTRLVNRHKTQTVTLVRKLTKDRLHQIKGQLAKIEAEIEARLRSAPKSARAKDILRSIPGVGEISAAAILIECPEIGTMGRKQIASLAGLAPMTRQSGQWKGHAFINAGRKFLRDALYMPALVATRFNPDMKAKYDSMRNAGKPAKVALAAIMRKLIELANALIKADRKWTQRST